MDDVLKIKANAMHIIKILPSNKTTEKGNITVVLYN